MKTLLFAALFALSSLVHAASAPAAVTFTGHWQGLAQFNDGRGFAIPCSFEFDLNQSGPKITLEKHALQCGYLSEFWPANLSVENRNGQLFFDNGQKSAWIGTITDHSMHASVHSCGVPLNCPMDVIAVYDIDVTDTELHYTAKWITVADQQTHMTISATLKRAAP